MWTKLSAYAVPLFLLQYVVLSTVQGFLLFDSVYSGGDFNLDYEAAQRATAGLNPYAPPTFFRPPFALIPIVPFTLLPQEAALLLWRVLDSAFFLAALPLSLCVAKEAGLLRSVSVKLLGGLGVLWAFSTLHLYEVYSGQRNGLVLLCLVGSYFLWRRGHRAEAGAAFGVATLTKVFPVFLVLLWLRKGDYVVLIWASLALVAGTVMGIMVFGIQTSLDYLPAAFYSAALAWSPFPGNLALGSTVALLWRQLQLPGDTIVASATRVIALTLALVAPAWMHKGTQQPQTTLDFAFMLTLLLVGGQLVEYHHLVLLLPAVTILLAALGSAGNLRWYLLLGAGLELIQVYPIVERLWGAPTATAGLLLVAALSWRLMRTYSASLRGEATAS